MREGRVLGESGRLARLAPVVDRSFDIPAMTRLAIGPSWASLTPAQQQQLIAAFGHYVAATYADQFDTYSGEQLQVTGAPLLDHAGAVVGRLGLVLDGACARAASVRSRLTPFSAHQSRNPWIVTGLPAICRHRRRMADPTQSKFGPNGEPFTIVGTAPLTLAGVTRTAHGGHADRLP